MRILGIIFYSSLLIFIGTVMILVAVVFSLKSTPINPDYVLQFISYLQNNITWRAVLGMSGFLIILISFFFAQLIIGRYQREKTIAFSTATGQVTISLSAVEDLIKKLSSYIPEIREMRPDVIATKKGSIIVDLRVILKSEANLPELTSRLQDIIRSKLQEVLGVEGQIIVKIHIAKIISFDDKDRKRKDLSKDKDETIFPYGGYSRL